MTHDDRRDDIAAKVFTQALAGAEGLGSLADADRQAMLEALACLSFEAAQAFVVVRKAIEGAAR